MIVNILDVPEFGAIFLYGYTQEKLNDPDLEAFDQGGISGYGSSDLEKVYSLIAYKYKGSDSPHYLE